MPAYCTLVRSADTMLDATPLSVLDGAKTFAGCDLHDFLTFTPTAWPDPTKPDGLPWKAVLGKMNPELVGGTDLDPFRTTMSRIRTLGLAYYFSGDARYARKTADLARVWFLDPKTRMNPNTRCEGIIPGKEPHGSTFSARSIMDANEALALIDGADVWSEADGRAFRGWLGDYLNWATTDPPNGGAHTANQPTNVGVFHDALVLYLALATGNRDLADRTARSAAERRIARDIEPDGGMPRELQRYNGWGYSILSMGALLTLAELSRHTSLDLFRYRTGDGRSIAKALDYLIGYAKAPDTWPYKGRPELSAAFREIVGRCLADRCGANAAAGLVEAGTPPVRQTWRLLYQPSAP